MADDTSYKMNFKLVFQPADGIRLNQQLNRGKLEQLLISGVLIHIIESMKALFLKGLKP